MKPVKFFGFLFLLSFRISSSFRVKRLAHSTSPTEKDHSPFPSFQETSQEDPALQRALHKVLREMNSRLNKTTYNVNNGDNNVTKKLKLFFVTPSGISDNNEEIKGFDLPDSRNNIESNRVNTFATDRKERTNFSDQFNTSIDAKTIHTSEGITERKKGLPLERVASTYFGGTKSSDTYEIDDFEAGHIYDRVGNEASVVIQNESQANQNDKMEMKVELTINLSESDHAHSVDSEDIAERGNLSYGSGKAHLTGRAEDPEMLGVHASHEVSEGNNQILNLATGNLNLNIKLISHNYSDSNLKQENGNESKSDIPQKRVDELGDQNPSNLSNSRRSEVSDNIKLSSLYNTHQEKSDAERYEEVGEQKFKPANNSNLSGIYPEAKFTRLPLVNRAGVVSDWIQTAATTEKYLSMTESSSLEVTEKNESMNVLLTLFPLSDYLKKEIKNISDNFNGEYDGNSDITGERNLKKFLPQKGGNPEEQREIDQLHKYFSQAHFLDKFGIRSKNSQTDFEVFIEVLRKLKRSNIVKGSSFYPILLYYLKLNDSLVSGTESDEDSESSDESWYSESFFSSLAGYIFDYDDQYLIRNSIKAKLNFLENEYEEDSGLNSGEYAYTFLK